MEAQSGGQERIGTVIAGTWRLVARLGSGGMATVYAARHERNGAKVAVKILHPQIAEHEESARRFLREGHLANEVGHPDVPRTFDDGVTDDGCPFLVMELLEGQTLESWLTARRAPLAVDEACAKLRRLLDILATAHDRGIAHRDVTPLNVFLTSDGAMKLLDFGLAFDTRASEEITGVGWGTPRAMAPEQITGEAPCDVRVDVWAAGTLFCRLVTGLDLFEVKTITELMGVHENAQDAVAGLAPAVPAPILRVIARALAYDPRSRWANAREMARALDEAERATARVSETLVMRPAPSASSRRTVTPAPASRRRPAMPISLCPRAYPEVAAPRAPALASARAGGARRAAVGLLLVSIGMFLTSVGYGAHVLTESSVHAAGE
ncbi:MAG: serine/threonine protein kinase [Deltaproteobacteria bacterium]|nr:serine/threonine protein kinase [Deltaproteobacteria bacterium]